MSGAPLFTAPLGGFRMWRLGPGGALLPLVASDGPWAVGENVAACARSQPEHPAPWPGCVCGLNAYWTLERLLKEPVRGHALGAVAAWGDADLYADGFRAQRAAVLALLRPDWSAPSSILELAAQRYGVPLLRRAELIAHVAAQTQRIEARTFAGLEDRDRVVVPAERWAELAELLRRRSRAPAFTDPAAMLALVDEVLGAAVRSAELPWLGATLHFTVRDPAAAFAVTVGFEGRVELGAAAEAGDLAVSLSGDALDDLLAGRLDVARDTRNGRIDLHGDRALTVIALSHLVRACAAAARLDPRARRGIAAR